jgi:hypothetical protein
MDFPEVSWLTRTRRRKNRSPTITWRQVLLSVFCLVPLAYLLWNHIGRLDSAPRASDNVSDTLGVADLVRHVKSELQRAAIQGKNEAPLFKLKDFELEVSFVAEVKSNGGVQFNVVTAGTDVRTERTQKLTIKMDAFQPQRANSRPSPGQPHMQKTEVEIIGPPPPKGQTSQR